MDHHDRRFDFFKLLATLSFVALLAYLLTGDPKVAYHAKSLALRFGLVPLVLAFLSSLLMLFVTMGSGESRRTLKPNEVDIRGFIVFLFSVGVPVLLIVGLFGVALLKR